MSISIRDISLSYNAIRALDCISLNLKDGEIHAVVGEHGAGKSSLAHILAGFRRPSRGELLIDGTVRDITDHQKAMAAGIEIVTQHNPLLDNMTVAENFLITERTGIFPLISKRGMNREAAAFMAEYGFDIPVNTSLSSLKLADRALVDILRHIYRNPRLLILDETIEKLSSESVKKVVGLLRKRAKEGTTVLFISHRVDDIYNIADRVTIVRDGRALLTEDIDHIDKMQLIRLAYTHALDSKDLANRETFDQILKYNEAILRDLPVSLLVCDGDGLIRMTNKAASDAVAEGNAVGRSILSVFPATSNEIFQGVMRETVGNTETLHRYQIPLTAEGRRRILNITVYPIMERSTLLGNIIILLDITEQEKLMESATMAENLKSLGLLAAGVAHEINNPLDIMEYHLENLRFHSGSEEQASSIAGIAEEIHAVAQIVSQLISFSGKSPPESEVCDLSRLTGDMAELLRYRGEESKISIEIIGSEEPHLVRADRNEMRQVLMNLVRNAFDAMAEGGSVRLTLSEKVSEGILSGDGPTLPQESPEGSSGFGSVAGRRTILTVDDTGSGIPEENIKDIFLPFYSSKEGSGRNMGLGLSLSYGLVRKYGGDITVENQPEGGCCFTVELPSG